LADKFESELAAQVVERRPRRLTRKAAFLLAAVAVCAMLGATTLYSVAMNYDTGAPMTEIVVFNQEKNELSETITTDEDDVVNVLATRTMSLKVKGDHDYAGPNCVLQNGKFIYVLNVGIQAVVYDSGETIEWEGMELGELTLPLLAGVLAVSNPVVTVMNGDTLITTVGNCAVLLDNVVTVSIPTLENVILTDETEVDMVYGVGYSISISVTIQTSADLTDVLIGEEVTEVAWDGLETRTLSIPPAEDPVVP
jgi:hypothetical protein